MPVEISPNTPLATALTSDVAAKLLEYGWVADNSDPMMSEYIVLMLCNGKTQEQISAEVAGELLGLAPDDPDVLNFTRWLFNQLEVQNAQLNGAAVQTQAPITTQDESMNNGGANGDDLEMDLTTGNDGAGGNDGPGDIDAPKGPKAMRNGNGINIRGGARDKRMLGQINRALDRNNDSILHRVRTSSGNSFTARVDSHGRGAPTGPRGMGVGRQPRGGNNRAASLAHGMAANGMMGMSGFQGAPGAMGPGMNGAWMMGQNQQAPDMVAMIQAQSALLQQMSEQLQMTQQMNGGQSPRGGGFNRGGRGSDRGQRGRGGHRGGHRNQQHIAGQGQGAESTEGADVDMAGGAPREGANPEETVCRYNLRCSNKDCKFAHQSPAAPPHTSVDITDVCSFGAACKNKKCTGRHPSPASKAAHQGELDCKFWPNCTNPRCSFKHPNMPPCRNGGDCNNPNCKFSHVQTECKFNPCTNRYCTFKHAEGQRGVFQDKVWTADGAKDHVSERKFVDENAVVDNVLPDVDEKGNVKMEDAEDVPIIT